MFCFFFFYRLWQSEDDLLNINGLSYTVWIARFFFSVLQACLILKYNGHSYSWYEVTWIYVNVVIDIFCIKVSFITSYKKTAEDTLTWEDSFDRL